MPTNKKPVPETDPENASVSEQVKEEGRVEAEEVPDAAASAEASSEEEKLRNELAEQKDKYLRLLAEYDNYRKRSLKEKEGIFAEATANAIAEFLPVFDNLERALMQQTSDEAYYKGIEMIMAQYKDILSKLGVTIFGERGEVFDPHLHSGVMHCEDPELGESVIAEVFQKGFKLGDRIIRCAVVQVAN
ncbi:MAG: nucleotide exchange factor GrpE [Oscillospiraceae bacterium]|jgi:molecular chaperone GrpE